MSENNEQSINNPHDKFFKGAFGIIDIVKPFLVQFLPKDLLDKLDLDTLEVEPTSYITDELSEYYADLVWACRFKGNQQKAEIAFLFEHKSYKPSHPHFQLIDYKSNSWKKKLAAKQKPITMIPIILYHGKEKWIVEPFESYFEGVVAETLRFLPSFDYILVNLQNYSDRIIQTFQSILLQKTLLAFKHYLETAYIKTNIVNLWLIGYDNQKNEQTILFIRMFGIYLSNISGVTRQEIITKFIQSDNYEKSEAMTIIDEFILEGFEKGIEKGIYQGIEKGKKIAIYEAHLRGNSFELLSNVFGLSVNEIKMVVDELKNEFDK